ncbi:hypothetical protein N7507_003947 [Penicillium longicatenatum]|nr:hypothetical protein N7507_003947 [Penicillium longicatenatum]
MISIRISSNIETFCSPYVFTPCESELELKQRLDKYKLYSYAAHHWGIHYRAVTGSLRPNVKAFLQNDHAVKSSSQVLLRHSLQTKSKGLHLAAIFGLEQAVEGLLDGSTEIDSRDYYGQTPLSVAAQKGNDAVVRVLLQRGANVDSKDSLEYRTPLFHAIAGGHHGIVELLLQNGAKADTTDATDMTPLSYASNKGHKEIAQSLFGQGVETESKIDYHLPTLVKVSPSHETFPLFLREYFKRIDMFESEDISGSRSPLAHAAHKGHEELVQVLLEVLLEEGADIKAKDICNMSPLALAAEQGHKRVVQILLENDAELNSKDKTRDIEGLTPLARALKDGIDEYDTIIQSLLEYGADWESVPSGTLSDPMPALHWAVYRNKEDIIQLLLERGAEIDSKYSDGETPLTIAVGSEHLGVKWTRFLLDKGADVNLRNSSGSTPIDIAASNGFDAVMQVLLDRGADQWLKRNQLQEMLSAASSAGSITLARVALGKSADVNAIDTNGKTALFEAAENGHDLLVQLLLTESAEIEAETRFGKTPLAGAVAGGHREIVQLLLAKGADLEARDIDGMTPLALAAISSRSEGVLELLLKRGKHH